jgi:lysyl-tRNA synthetase class 2
MMLKRVMGKASFATLQDATGRVQIYVTRDSVGEEVYAAFKHWDLGDIVACEGHLFKTRTGELSVHATSVRLLTKSLRPMPDKFHGIHDQEVKYRQRYVDLMTDEEARKRFVARSRAITGIRDFMVQHHFLEVETPMLHPIPGGANARPFTTHHNALDRELYLRIATELYLKRAVVGGIERVFEIGRVFRNEGVDSSHSPEFTTLEAYEAYADQFTMAERIQEIILACADALGVDTIETERGTIDLRGPWRWLSVYPALSEAVGRTITPRTPVEELRRVAEEHEVAVDPAWDAEKHVLELFGEIVEPTLLQPTFVCDYPPTAQPLARQHRSEHGLIEAWDLIIGGMERGTAFSELIDPVVQRERLTEQSRRAAAGDAEAMRLDEDFLRALEHGAPPMGGLGLGLDRLIMLFTDLGIRETILFPLMKPEQD